MPTLLENGSLEENAALCRELGLQFLEINMNLPEYQADRLGGTRLFTDVARTYGIFYTIHLEEQLDPCAFNPAAADAYLATAVAAVRAARVLGAPIVNLHMNPGTFFTLPGGRVYLYERYEQHYLERLLRFRRQCETAAGGEVALAVENTDGYAPFLQRGVELLLESPAFCLTWDVGHSHAAQGVDEPFLLRHADRLRHFHLHDAACGRNHLPLGNGEINIKGKLDTAARCGCRCVVETKTVRSLRDSAAWLRDRGYL